MAKFLDPRTNQEVDIQTPEINVENIIGRGLIPRETITPEFQQAVGTFFERNPLGFTEQQRNIFGLQLPEKRQPAQGGGLRGAREKAASDIEAQRTALATRRDISIANIAAQRDAIVAEQKDINNRLLEKLRKSGIRGGSARFAPLISGGILSGEESRGLEKIAGLKAKFASIISDVEAAFEAQDFKLIAQKNNQIIEIEKNIAEETKKMLEKAQKDEEDKKKKEEEAQKDELNFKKDEFISNTINSFIEEEKMIDPLEIFNETKKSGLNIEIGDVANFLEQINKEEEKNKDKEELSINEISKINKEFGIQLPFGTTLGEAKEKNLIPKPEIKTIRREDLSALDRLKARNLSVRLFGKRAGTKIENISLIEDLKAQGFTFDNIEDQLKFSSESQLFTGFIRDAAESIASSLSSSKREDLFNSIDRRLEEGKEDSALDLMEKAAIDSFGVEESRTVRGTKRTIELVNEIQSDLNKYERKGGDTNVFIGSIEKISERIVGATMSEDLAKIANKIRVAIQRYRRTMSGVAFSVPESKEYKSIFPDIDNISSLNSALTSSLNEVLQGDYDFSMRDRIGKEAYEKLFKNRNSFLLDEKNQGEEFISDKDAEDILSSLGL